MKLVRVPLTPERVQQLAREFDRLIGTRLTHPVIVAPLAAGIVDLTPYFVERFVVADSLDIVIRDRGPVQPADALRVVADLAGALDSAAAKGVFHGALHPRDVLLSNDDTRLTGLGIAQALEGVGAAAPIRRPYTAPERVAGETWDGRADIFSLAAMAYELLWRRRLTVAGNEVAGSLTEISGGDLERLGEAFARALAEDPAERFDTSHGFAEALETAFSRRPLAESEPTVRRQQGTRRRSRPVLSIVRDEGAPEDRLSAEARLPLEDSQALIDEALSARPSPVAAIDDLSLRASEPPADPDVEIGRPLDGAERAAAFEVEPVIAFDDGDVRPIATVRVDGPRSVDLRSDTEADFTSRPEVADAASRVVEFQPAGAARRTRVSRSGLTWFVALFLVAVFAAGYWLGSRAPLDSMSSPDGAAAALEAAAPVTVVEDPAVVEPVGDSAVTRATSSSVSPGTGSGGRADGAGGPAPSSPATARDAAAVPATPRQAERAPEPAAPVGRLLVRSTPAGARVSVNGRDEGRTPVTLRNLAAGTYTVQVTSDGFVRQERRVSITAARPSQSLTFELVRATNPAGQAQSAPVPATGSLQVDSRPAGARVLLDGQFVGATPLVLAEVATGSHAVTLELEGYRPWTTSVRVAGGQQNRLAASLER